MTPIRLALTLVLSAAAWCGSVPIATAQFADSDAARHHAFDGYDGFGFKNGANRSAVLNPYGGYGLNPYAGAGYRGTTNDWYYDHYNAGLGRGPALPQTRLRTSGAYRSRLGTGLYNGYGYDAR